METIAVPETVAAVKSPFQLFSAFTEKDNDKFFGREKETALLYQSVQEANVVLVYGESGTGKTSIVQCGLLNETKHFNWSSITIRRIDDMNTSLFLQLNNAIKDESIKSKKLGITELMNEVFITNFQPILLVFDQFEEIFVYGNVAERLALSENISQISTMRIPWKMVFVIREDFLAQLDEFEKELPGLFKKRLRIELMDKSNCREVVVKSCDLFKISLIPLRMDAMGQTDMAYNEVAADTPDIVINTVCDTRNAIHLPYFQVFLDRLWKEAWTLDSSCIKIDDALVQKVGNMGDVLKAFLEEKVNAQKIISPVDAWRFLKLFVPEKGTTRKKVKLKEYSAIPEKTLGDVVDYFADYKILTGCAVNSYELAHESLVPIIQRIQLNEIRPRLTVPTIKGSPYKGLASFDQSDSYRFYGRKEAVNTLYEKVKLYDFVAIVGNSGAGKSSLIKAGLFPLLINDGYKILSVVKAGDSPVAALTNSYSEAIQDNQNKKFILLIDQYEELNTRISQNQTREDVYNWIAERLAKQKVDPAGMIIKIIITIRADFEPQFSIKPQLANYWKLGKYIIPPFTREEIREVIEEPAYQAGLEFSPPSLVEKIAEEVYSSQSTGLLPLMSFTLKELYNKYVERGANDNLLREEDYTELGGVIGGLQNRAQYIYDRFTKDHPDSYKKYQTVMKHIILRMIYLSTGEIAGQRVLKEKFTYNNDETNIIKEEILKSLIASHLIVSGINNKNQEYYEPAHDVFIRSWGQIWDWINTAGKDKLSLRSRLTQASEEYYANDQKPELLWDNKLTDGLLKDMQSENSWLNKDEYDFIAASIKKRDEAAAMVQKIEEEKIRDQQEKEQYREQTIIYQRKKINAFRTYMGIILVLLAVAAAMFFWANKQRSEAVKYSKKADDNLKIANTANARINSLYKALGDTNRILSTNRIELQKQADSLEQQAKDLIQKTLLAKNAELKARKAEQKANNAVIDEKSQRIKAEGAEVKANSLSTELALKADSAVAAKSRIEKLFQELVKTNASRDSAKTALDIQKQQNITQLINRSKALESTDIVKAYRVAEQAYKKDSLDADVNKQYHKLLNQSAYFYTKQLNGNSSKYSLDGNYILNATFTTGSAGAALVELFRNSTFDSSNKTFANSTVIDDLISVDFSPSSQYVIFTHNNKIEVSRVNNLKEKTLLKVKEKDIFSATFSQDEENLLIIADKHFSVYRQPFNSGQTVKTLSGDFGGKEKVSNAVFSNDGKRVIASSESGKVTVWDALSGKQVVDVVPQKNILNTWLSPGGNYFISATSDALYLYDSQGKLSDKKDIQYKYGKLNSATFSPDGQEAILSFTSSTLSKEQYYNPKMDRSNNINLQVMNMDTKINLVDITSAIPQEDLNLFAGNAPNIITDGNLLLYSTGYGLVKSLNLKNRTVNLLPGHSKPVNTMSVLNGGRYIMTSANDNTTKIWQYSTPQNLIATGLLPTLSDEDFKNFGIDK